MKHFATVFNQFLKLVPRYIFRKCVDHYKGDYRVRTFDCWSQFGVMTYAQVSGKVSTRDVVVGFNKKENYFYHFGLKNVAKPTLADANMNRDHHIYEELFNEILLRCRDLAPKHKFRFKNPLKSFDATTIDLCLATFPWAEFRQAKGAIKLHTELDHRGHLPDFVYISDGKTHESRIAQLLQLEAGSIAVFDRAMIKYRWLNEIHDNDAYFVTRMKTNMKYVVVEKPTHKLPALSKRARKAGVISDQVIRLTGSKAREIPIELRLVVYKDPETGHVYELLTNIFHLSALTVAQIYKERWQIEIFFKWIKQHLKVKSFLGTTENAVKTQIWIAMITYLLLSYIKYQTRCQYSLLHIQRLIRERIFARLNLNELLSSAPTETNNDRGDPTTAPAQMLLRF